MQSRDDKSSNDWRELAREAGWPASRTSARHLQMRRAESACDRAGVPLERAQQGSADNAAESIADRYDRKMSLDLCVSLNCSTLTEIQQDFATAISGGADLVELRLDYLKPAELDRLTELEEWFGRNADRLIVSFRPVDQGGLHDGDTATRVSTLLWAGGLRPRYIDFEYACFARSDDMRDKARLMASAGDDNRWDRLILSEHHLEQRPPTLERKFLDMCATPAERLKLVWRARNANGNFKAFDLLKSQAAQAIV